MPKVKNPLFSQEARGGIGGLVYNTWRGINYVKTNTSPTGQGTAKRLIAQAIMSFASKLWQGLENAQRAAWSQYAIDHPVPDWTGTPKRLTGMNWFVMLNSQLKRFDLTPIEDPPVDPDPSPLTGFALSKDGANITVTWDSPPPEGGMCDIFLVGPHSAGVTGKIQMAKYKTAFGTGPPPPQVLVTDAAVGRYTAFARNFNQTTGQVSTWVSAFLDFTT